MKPINILLIPMLGLILSSCSMTPRYHSKSYHKSILTDLPDSSSHLSKLMIETYHIPGELRLSRTNIIVDYHSCTRTGKDGTASITEQYAQSYEIIIVASTLSGPEDRVEIESIYVPLGKQLTIKAYMVVNSQ
jgi:hypothetical protein